MSPQEMAAATRPLPHEVQRLRQRVLTRRRAQPHWGWGVAAAILVCLIPWGNQHEIPARPNGLVTTGQNRLSPAINMSGWGSAQVSSTNNGAEVTLNEGFMRFEVDPEGAERQLRVQVDDVEVEVTGTVFWVRHLENTVSVGVLRGQVLVRQSGETNTLGPGDKWTRSDPVGVEQQAPVPAPTVRASSPPKRVASDSDSLVAILERAKGGGSVRTHLERWLTRFPKSPLRAEAELLFLRALGRELPTGEAVVAIAEWVVANPTSRHVVDAQELRATIARNDLQDCSQAIPSYQAVVDASMGARRGQAAAYLGLCAASTGDEALAVQSLTEAVQHPLPAGLAGAVERRLHELRGL